MNSQNHQTVLDVVNAIVLDVVDTVATFDGRLAFSSMDGGRVFVEFGLATGSSPRVYRLEIVSTSVGQDNVQITMQTFDASSQAEVVTVYAGTLDQRMIRHRLGVSLAEWYGQVIRNQVLSS